MARKQSTKTSKKERDRNKIFSFFGAGEDEPTAPPPSKRIVPRANYSEAELTALPKIFSRGKTDIRIDDLKNVLSPVSKMIEDQTKTNKSHMILTPELEKAKQVWVSSILSPINLQTGTVNLSCDLEGLSEKQRADITKLLNDYFRYNYDLGSKLAEWIGDMMFESGAHPVMSIPRSELRNLMNAVVKDLNKKAAASSGMSRGFEGLSISTESVAQLVTDQSFKVSLEEVLGEIDLSDELSAAKCDAGVEALSAYCQEFFTDFLKENKPEDLLTFDLDVLAKVSNEGAALNNDMVDVMLEGYAVSTEAKKSKTSSEQEGDGFIQGNKNERVVHFDTNKDTTIGDGKGKLETDDVPIAMELPTSSVIPGVLPGSKETHLCYFVLIDENGVPVTPDTRHMNSSRMTEDYLVRQTMLSHGGGRSIDIFSNKPNNQQVKWNALNAAFSIAVKQIMESGAQKAGFSNISIANHNAISTCMFHNMMKQRNVRLLYVPEPMMVYYRLDHRDDGTGKAMTEDIEFILTLRGTLYVAFVLSNIQNSIRKHRVSFEIPDELIHNTGNISQMIQVLQEEFFAKNAFNFSTNPTAITKDLTMKTLEVVPRNLPGMAGGLNIEKETENGRMPIMDSNLMEQLDDMWMARTLLSPSVFNSLGEAEFSRSIVVQNLFMANCVRMFQTKLTPLNSKFLRNYVSMCDFLRKGIQTILDTTDVSDDEDGDKKKKDKGTADVDAPEKINIKDVISCLTVVLPTPNIAIVRSQFEEIENFIRTAQSIAEALLPNDLVGEEREDQAVVSQLRNMIVADMVRKFISVIGETEFLDVPGLGDAIEKHQGSLMELMRKFQNMKGAFKGQTATQTGEDPNAEESSDSGGGSSW